MTETDKNPRQVAPQSTVEPLTDAQILAMNSGEIFFSESPSLFPEAGHGTQYHCGAPGLLNFARALLAAAPPNSKATEPIADAYIGAREDLAIWKKRALEAEDSCRRLTAALNEENGPTFMHEPRPGDDVKDVLPLYTAPVAQALPVAKDGD